MGWEGNVWTETDDEEEEKHSTESESESEEEEECSTESESEEEEEEYVWDTESEEEEEDDIMESAKEEDIMETVEEEKEPKEDEKDEAEEKEEMMRPPVVTSWMGPDGSTVHGIMCIDDGIIRKLKNRCQLDDCPICYKPSTMHGRHQICSLPCGHMYGSSCIKKWLSSSSGRKCPQCNTLCSFNDSRPLYPHRLCVFAHQEASSATLFPFTKQGVLDFEKYEFSRKVDARRLRANDKRHYNKHARKHRNLVDRRRKYKRWYDIFITRAAESEERDEELGPVESLAQADEWRRQASLLQPHIDALGPRINALRRRASALRRRFEALGQLIDAYESRMTFYRQMYKEHHKMLALKKDNEPCTTCP